MAAQFITYAQPFNSESSFCEVLARFIYLVYIDSPLLKCFVIFPPALLWEIKRLTVAMTKRSRTYPTYTAVVI